MSSQPSPFGLYIHVPFCASRCGYCDFNTYTPGELGSSASPDSYLDALERELGLAELSPLSTIFIGGGTPSMLGAEGLARIMRAVRANVEILPGAEVTTEANPESTSPEFFDSLLGAGFTRVSLGMQSASPRVLEVLDRAHTPGRPFAAVREAKAAGFAHINLDIIYGTPTETDEDVQVTLERTVDSGVDHVSAYSLIVEEGTAMARKLRKGQLSPTSEDVYADRYHVVDEALRAAGFEWYEVSNWARPGGQCRHNLGYWRGDPWWGAGPGAHSFIGGRRFFHVKHPATYASLLSDGALPIKDSEVLSAQELHEEQLMLRLRLKEGIDISLCRPGEIAVAQRFAAQGLLRVDDQRIAVTEAGRLLVDGMIADMVVAGEREGDG